MKDLNKKKDERPFWKRPVILLYGIIAFAGLGVLVYISLIFDFSPMTNALIGAAIASVIGFSSPRPS